MFLVKEQVNPFELAVNRTVQFSCVNAAKPHTVILLWALCKTDTDSTIVLCVCSVVCLFIKCLPAEISIVALKAFFPFHQARASTARLNPIPANAWSLDEGPEAACTSIRYLLFSALKPCSYSPNEPKHPSSTAASLIQTQRGATHSVLEITQNPLEHFST